MARQGSNGTPKHDRRYAVVRDRGRAGVGTVRATQSGAPIPARGVRVRRLSLSELATAVRLRTDDGRLDQASVEAVLHHVDLPKLDAAGVIYYDAGSNRVLCPDTEPVAELVDLIDEQFE